MSFWFLLCWGDKWACHQVYISKCTEWWRRDVKRIITSLNRNSCRNIQPVASVLEEVIYWTCYIWMFKHKEPWELSFCPVKTYYHAISKWIQIRSAVLVKMHSLQMWDNTWWLCTEAINYSHVDPNPCDLGLVSHTIYLQKTTWSTIMVQHFLYN